jgi:hypothetical protein
VPAVVMSGTQSVASAHPLLRSTRDAFATIQRNTPTASHEE